jgi:hypothetical protein
MAKHERKEPFPMCARCRTPIGGGQYGEFPNGDRLCYQCCAKYDKETMRETGKIILYLAESKEREGTVEICNWPGSLKFPLLSVRNGRHNIARTQTSVRFVGPDGHVWSGRQYGSSELCYCRRTRWVA